MIAEINALLNTLMDEADATHVSNAQRSVLLERGHSRFRNIVSRSDPEFYSLRVTTTPVTDSYDLATAAVILLGNGVLTGPRLANLLKVEDVDGAGDFLGYWIGANGWDELRDRYNTYLLRSTILHFHSTPPGNVRLTYIPVSSVVWTDLAAVTTPDDLTEFHDVIALLAYRYYSVRDVATNSEVDSLLAERLAELELYLVQGRSPEAGNHVGKTKRR